MWGGSNDRKRKGDENLERNEGRKREKGECYQCALVANCGTT